MDFAVGRVAHALDPFHSFVYFHPDVDAEFIALGLDDVALRYFAGRAAPMGAVGAGVVTATFYNFSPRLVSAVVPKVWTIAAPGEIAAARLRGVDTALRRALGDTVDSADMSEAARLAESAARAIPGVDGRPLYAGHADLPWPDRPHLVLWHALTLLREYRGDGHIAALHTAGLDGLDALITHTAAGTGFTEEVARTLRGWSRDEWNAAQHRLRHRGLLDRTGEPTGEGFEIRELVEDLTDDLAAAPWDALGEEDTERLLDLVLPWRDEIVAATSLSADMFGPRYGDPR